MKAVLWGVGAVVLGVAGVLIALSIPKSAGLLEIVSSTERGVLIRDVRLFDGVSAELELVAGVRLEGERITAIYRDMIPADLDGFVVEGRGRVLMPALIDFHVHFGMSDGMPVWATPPPGLPDLARQHEAMLYSGVTSVVEGSINPLAPFIRPPAFAPRSFKTGKQISALEGHPIPMLRELVPWPVSEWFADQLALEVSSFSEVVDEVEEIAGSDIDYLKVIFDDSIPWKSPRLSAADVGKVVDIARGHGKPVFVHVGDPNEAVDAVEAGATVLMHTPYVGTFSSSQLNRLWEHQVPVVTTSQIWLWIMRGTSDAPAFTDLETFLMPEEVAATYRTPRDEALAAYSSVNFDLSYVGRIPIFDSVLKDNVLTLYKAGVPIIAGTDTGVPGLTYGASLIFELQRLQGMGIPPIDVLKSATSVPGRILGSEDMPLGVVQEGAAAELILLPGDPLTDVSVLQELDLIITQGQVLRRAQPLSTSR